MWALWAVPASKVYDFCRVCSCRIGVWHSAPLCAWIHCYSSVVADVVVLLVSQFVNAITKTDRPIFVKLIRWIRLRSILCVEWDVKLY